MHTISKKDLSNMDILTKSCRPTMVVTANGEVQTHEEATVHVTAILAQGHFVQTSVVCAQGEVRVFALYWLLRPLARFPHTMFRNYWQVPGTEWVQILRGPRLPSVKWPKVGQQHQRQPGKPSKPPQFHPEKGGSLSKPVWDRPSMLPQQMRAAATERGVIKASIAALRAEDTEGDDSSTSGFGEGPPCGVFWQHGSI